MAKEMLVSTIRARTVYAVGRVENGDNIGRWGNIIDGTLNVFNGVDWVKYAITMTELDSSGFYEADFPDVFDNERAIDIVYYMQNGANPSQLDEKISGALFEIMDDWIPTVPLDV